MSEPLGYIPIDVQLRARFDAIRNGEGPFPTVDQILQHGNYPITASAFPWVEDNSRRPDSLWIRSGRYDDSSTGVSQVTHYFGINSSKRIGIATGGVGEYENFSFLLTWVQAKEGGAYSVKITTGKGVSYDQEKEEQIVIDGEVKSSSPLDPEFDALLTEAEGLVGEWRKFVEDNKHTLYMAPRKTQMY